MGRSRSSCSTGRSGDPHYLSTGRQALPERAPADTIARVNPRATAIGIALSLGACAGWIETRSDRFVSAEKFPGVWVEFSKDDDICRLTVIAGAGATHVDYTLARVNPGS